MPLRSRQSSSATAAPARVLLAPAADRPGRGRGPADVPQRLPGDDARGRRPQPASLALPHRPQHLPRSLRQAAGPTSSSTRTSTGSSAPTRPSSAARTSARRLDAVKALPERQRDALVLRELEAQRYDEIASELGVGDGAVRQLLHRARTTLRAGASAITPVGLLDRLMAITQSADPAGRVAEVAAGVGGGVGIAKIGVAVLATGALAGGAATAPAHPPFPPLRNEHGRDQTLGLRQVRQRHSADPDGGRPARLAAGRQRRLERARLGLGLANSGRAATTPRTAAGKSGSRQQRILGRHQRRLEQRLERRRRQVRLERQRLRIERQLGIHDRSGSSGGSGRAAAQARAAAAPASSGSAPAAAPASGTRMARVPGGLDGLRLGLRPRQGHHRARRRRRRSGSGH